MCLFAGWLCYCCRRRRRALSGVQNVRACAFVPVLERDQNGNAAASSHARADAIKRLPIYTNNARTSMTMTTGSGRAVAPAVPPAHKGLFEYFK